MFAGRRFIGREVALERLAQHFARGARLVTVWGPGGVGKTRLASQFASAGPHGLAPWFCDLSDVRERSEIVEALARTFEIPVGAGGIRDAIQQVGRAIAHRGRCLVILDNFEQLIPHAAATVGRWLALAPLARFVVTSRERLGIDGELTLELEPMSLPGERGEHPTSSEAVELFVERVRATNPEFRVGDETLETIARIVRRLEGLPLAIELACARVPVLGLDGLETRLSARLEVLVKGASGAPARQATLRGALEWSWELLSASEREALASTSVFRGGFSLDSAEAVLGSSAVDRLESLREKALLLSAQDAEFPARMRFGLFEAVREFAAEKLDDRTREIENLHRKHFQARAVGWRRARDDEATLRELANERQNLLAVIDRCLTESPPDAATAVDVAVALDPILARGPAQARLELFERVLAAARPSEVDPALLSEGFIARGAAARLRGQADLAGSSFATARSLARRANAPEIEAAALVETGIFAHERRRLDEARICYEEALTLANAPRTRARALGNLGAVFHDVRRFDEGRERYRESLSLCALSGDRRLEGAFRFNLAILEQERGDRPEAREQYQRALARLRETRDRRLLAIASGSLGTLLEEEGDWAGALALHDDALKALREIGDVRSEGLALGRTGAALAMLGRVPESRDALDEAERLLVGLGDEVALAAIHLFRAFIDLAALQAALVRGDSATRDRHHEAVCARLADARKPRGREPAPADLSDDVRIALRILDRALAKPVVPEGPRLLVGPNAMWFEAPGHRRGDLSRHAAARRILLRLLEERRSGPRKAVPLDALREAGWPGEQLTPDAAANRTHVTLALLRKQGLKAHLLREETGYFLDPDLVVEWAER